VPFRAADPRREELRNSPTILDAGLMPRLHFDGEFASLEELVKGTLAGRPMGWLPGEQDRAFEHLSTVILTDTDEGAKTEGGYPDQFKGAYGVNVTTLTRTEVINLVAKALSDYMRTQKTARTTPYDRFIELNGLDAGPARGENAKQFASRLLDKLAALEERRALKLTSGFDAAALRGLKIFLSGSSTGSAGNCVTCHTPPLFTDLSFHNMGISQSEYDQVNGEGSFADLEVPGAEAAGRPSAQFRETPSKRKPGCVDLGHWNFVDLKTSPLRRAAESDDRFLQRMIGTFKTPTLRNLAYSAPYMHTGGLSTVESAIDELARLSRMARAGQVREGDEELAKIRITESDSIQLAAFLQTLNENLKR
jgi:cytochrome c peroxidase